MSIDEIITALETATGPSRDLDEALYGELGYWSSSAKADGPAPAYTASIDAALTLVPEGLSLGFTIPYRRDAVVLAFKPKPHAQIWEPLEQHRGRGEAATPAIALCIAALRAGQVQS